jgi:hypothetical protein
MSRGKQFLPANRWRGWFLFISILLGGILLGNGLNYGARLLGLCKFPPAYELFVPDVEPKEGVAVGLISSYDFGCKWYKKSSLHGEFESLFPGKFQRPFEQEYHRTFSGEYEQVDNEISVEQSIWVMKDEVTELDTQAAFDLYGGLFNSPETHMQINKIPVARFQKIYCSKAFGFNCAIVIGFNRTLTSIHFFGFDNMTREAFEEVVNIAIGKTSQRLVLIDANLP